MMMGNKVVLFPPYLFVLWMRICRKGRFMEEVRNPKSLTNPSGLFSPFLSLTNSLVEAQGLQTTFIFKGFLLEALMLLSKKKTAKSVSSAMPCLLWCQLTKLSIFCLVMVQEDYHGHNPYHNAVHAADVTQAMHCYLKEPKVKQDLVASSVTWRCQVNVLLSSKLFTVGNPPQYDCNLFILTFSVSALKILP